MSDTLLSVGLPPDLTPDRRRLRRLKRRKALIQGAIVAAAVLLVITLAYALRASLAARGVGFSFGFLTEPAGFQISEGQVPTTAGLLRFDSGMTNAQALLAAAINTVKMAVLAIAIATVIGAAIGVGRLSTNGLIRTLCFYVVEFLRNTPLLIQVTFWYTAVVLSLPSVTATAGLPGGIYIARQGIFIPWFEVADAAPVWAIAAGLAGLAALLAGVLRRSLRRLAWIAGVALITAAVAGGLFTGDVPKVGKFNASGGLRLSAEFTALLIAITLCTAGHLGEIVRGTIESMPKGQWEAAAALGYSRSHTLRDIILPQVFRIVLPSFGNKYIGLAKDTSLGIAIGYPDLFNVAGTVANQTGRMLETLSLLVICYLAMSLTISAGVNALNRRLGRKETR